MSALNLNLLAVIFEDPHFKGELIGIGGGGYMAKTHRPIVVKIFGYPTPGIPSCIRGEVEGCVGHEGHIQELPAKIARVRILVEKVDHAEIAKPDDEAPAIHRCPKLHRIGSALYALPSKPERLLEKQPRLIIDRRFRAAFLQLEVLYRSAQPFQIR